MPHTRAPSRSAASTANRPVPQPTSSSRVAAGQLARASPRPAPASSAGRAQLVVVAGQRGEVASPGGRRIGRRRVGELRASPRISRGAPRSAQGTSITSKSRGTTVWANTACAPRGGSRAPCSGWTGGSAPAASPGRRAPAAAASAAVAVPGLARPVRLSSSRKVASCTSRSAAADASSVPGTGGCRPRTRCAGPAGPCPPPGSGSTTAPDVERHRLAVLQLRRTAARSGTPRARAASMSNRPGRTSSHSA